MPTPSDTTKALLPPLAALTGWLLPGAGYWLIGQRARGLTVGITILSLFVLGLLIGGVRVVVLPGYENDGRPVRKFELMAEIRDKPWYVGQILAGPISYVTGKYGVSVARSSANPQGVPPSHARVNDIGTLYTAVAGMLNLMAIIDSAYRAGQEGRR